MHNYVFKCGADDCNPNFRKYISLVSYYKRKHKTKPYQRTFTESDISCDLYKRAQPDCTLQFLSNQLYNIVKHVKFHILNAELINYPYHHCHAK